MAWRTTLWIPITEKDSYKIIQFLTKKNIWRLACSLACHYSAKSNSPMNIFHWVTTKYIILNMLNTEKDPEFCVKLLFCIELRSFSHFLQGCLNSRPQWYKACITSEILIRDDIIFGLKITHKTALPSIRLKKFTSLCQLHNKPRQKHRKSNFLWSIFGHKWPKFIFRCHGNHFVLRGKWVLYSLFTWQNTSYIQIWGKSERCHVQPSLVAM